MKRKLSVGDLVLVKKAYLNPNAVGNVLPIVEITADQIWLKDISNPWIMAANGNSIGLELIHAVEDRNIMPDTRDYLAAVTGENKDG